MFRRRREAGRANPAHFGGGGGTGNPGALSVPGGDDDVPAKVERLIDEALSRRIHGAGLELSPWELPITVACRQLVADTVAQLPFIAYRNGLPRADQPAIAVRPDPGEPAWLTKHRLVNNLTGWGYVWLLPTAFRGYDEVAAVRVIDASRVAGTFDSEGRPEYARYNGERYDIGTDGIMWIPWRVTASGSWGTAPAGDCWRAMEFLAALYQMAGSFWEAGFPSVAVMLDQTLTSQQRLELREQLYGAWSRRHEPAIIDRGGKLQPVGSSAIDAQLVESVEWANTEIARAFGVMPSLVNVRAGDSLTYSTTSAEFTKWLKIGLGGYLMRIDSAWSDLCVHGTTVRSDTSELLRSDGAARAAFYTAALAAGWMTLAEIRAMEGLPPLPAGIRPPSIAPGAGDSPNLSPAPNIALPVQ